MQRGLRVVIQQLGVRPWKKGGSSREIYMYIYNVMDMYKLSTCIYSHSMPSLSLAPVAKIPQGFSS